MGQRFTAYRESLKAQILTRDFLTYLIKCLLATVICYGLYLAFPRYPLYWSLVSMLLVLAPDREDSIKLPLDRIKANITGGLIGLACFFIPLHQLWCLCIGIPVTILVCYLMGSSNSTRSALAAMIIVYLQGMENNDWIIALDRMVAVVFGCLAALLLTMVFYWGEKLYTSRPSKKHGASKPATEHVQ